SCGLKPGKACAVDSDCATSCNGGYCCAGWCDICQDCAASTGACVNVTNRADTSGSPTCSGNYSCSPTSTCSYINGLACTSDLQCASGFCADGVCCNSACTGKCQACNLGGSVGTCSSVLNADDTSTVTANSCTGGSTCDGTGTCKLKTG